MRPFRFLAFVPTIIVLVVITYLSLAKNPVHSQEFYLFEGADKLVHGCMYLGLVWDRLFRYISGIEVYRSQVDFARVRGYCVGWLDGVVAECYVYGSKCGLV